MKKKFLSIALVMTLLLTGCGTLNEEKIKESFIKDSENLKSYYIEGEMSLTNNDDTYKYDVEVSYKKDDNYKVVLTNKSNNYKQIILKNNDGVYVISPSINKSFKFQSTWPNNNSQVYLLGSLVNDIKNDKEATFEQQDNNFILTTKVNYPNNPTYKKQQIILREKNEPSEVFQPIIFAEEQDKSSECFQPIKFFDSIIPIKFCEKNEVKKTEEGE